MCWSTILLHLTVDYGRSHDYISAASARVTWSCQPLISGPAYKFVNAPIIRVPRAPASNRTQLLPPPVSSLNAKSRVLPPCPAPPGDYTAQIIMSLSVRRNAINHCHPCRQRSASINLQQQQPIGRLGFDGSVSFVCRPTSPDRHSAASPEYSRCRLTRTISSTLSAGRRHCENIAARANYKYPSAAERDEARRDGRHADALWETGSCRHVRAPRRNCLQLTHAHKILVSTRLDHRQHEEPYAVDQGGGGGQPQTHVEASSSSPGPSR